MGVTRIESNRNRHFGLKIESKSIENRNLEIVTSLVVIIVIIVYFVFHVDKNYLT